MAGRTNAELLELVERLRAENEELRSEVLAASAAASASAVHPGEGGGAGDGGSGREGRGSARRGRGRGRTAASVALLVVGLVLAPVAVVGHWAQTQLADTEAFVATFAPLAQDEAVKALVVAEVMAAVDEQIDFEQTTGDVFDAVGELGLPPAASAALNALKAPAALGLRSLATNVVTGFVESEAFEDIWAQALRVSHRQLVATLTDQPGSAVALSSTGELSIQLGPVISAVKAAMVAQGLTFADAIPAIDRSVVVAQNDSFGQIKLAYGLAVGIGQWLPWVTLLFLAAGVLLAKRRTVTVFAAGLSLGVVMVLLGIAVRIGSVVTAASLAPYLSIEAAQAVYDAVTSLMAATIVAIAVLGFTVMLVAWALGPFRPAPALRRVFGEAAVRLRRYGDTRGVTTGAFGRFLGRQRVLVEVLIGVVAAATVLLVRPLSTGQIVWTAVVAVLLLLVVELLQRPLGDTSA